MPTSSIEVADMPAPASSSSDSGVSSDQQFSPLLHEIDDDDKGDLLSSLSSGSESSSMATSQICSDQEGSLQEDMEIDSSIFNIIETAGVGELEVKDNQAIISMSMSLISCINTINISIILEELRKVAAKPVCVKWIIVQELFPSNFHTITSLETTFFVFYYIHILL